MMDDAKNKALEELVFISEIVKQTKIAERAFERLEVSSNEAFDEIEIWSSIQSILIAAGNVSRILWPSRKSSLTRGQRLRMLLEVDEEFLIADRNLRNHFEHYDERVEDWFKDSRSAVYIDSSINSFKSIWGRDFGNTHRAYSPLTKVLTFRSESVDLAEVLNVLNKIRHKCSHHVLP